MKVNIYSKVIKSVSINVPCFYSEITCKQLHETKFHNLTFQINLIHVFYCHECLPRHLNKVLVLRTTS